MSRSLCLVGLMAVCLLALAVDVEGSHAASSLFAGYDSLLETRVGGLPTPGQKCGLGSRGTCTANSAWCARYPGTTATAGLCTGANGQGRGYCCQPTAARAPTPAPAPKTPAKTTTPPASKTVQPATAFGNTAVERAATWVRAKLRYCQAPRGGVNANYSPGGKTKGKGCPIKICERENNPAWNAYRSDCSGLVSFAWGLSPAQQVSTSSMSTAARAIQCRELRAGDAINRAGSHTMLFVRWITPFTTALMYEEPGCAVSQPYAREVTLTVTINGSNMSSNRGAFVCMRKNGQ